LTSRAPCPLSPCLQARNMAQPAELIGSQISLISNKDIRYEGILYAINAEESSVTLQNGEFRAPFLSLRLNVEFRAPFLSLRLNVEHTYALGAAAVRCFGTEGRGPAEWKPDATKMWDYVQFNASDIKDLHVHHGPGKTVSPTQCCIASRA
jgi:hypothetical protein